MSRVAPRSSRAASAVPPAAPVTIRLADSDARSALLGWPVVLLGLALLLPTLREIAHTWASHPYAGHGVFVPVLSAWMLWSLRDRLSSGGGRSWGLFILGAGLALSGLGHASQSLPAHVLAVIVAAAGVALYLRGPEWVRQAAFPLGFLLFMLPLPREVVAAVTVDLQHFIAWSSAALLDRLQFPVHQEGLLIYLPTVTLRVDRGCNGLRFLMVLLVVVIGFAQVYVPQRLRRLTVIAAAIPAAILANVLRVTAIAVATQLVGPDAADNWIHDYIGRALWAATLAGMMAFAVVLRRTERLSTLVL